MVVLCRNTPIELTRGRQGLPRSLRIAACPCADPGERVRGRDFWMRSLDIAVHMDGLNPASVSSIPQRVIAGLLLDVLVRRTGAAGELVEGDVEIATKMEVIDEGGGQKVKFDDVVGV